MSRLPETPSLESCLQEASRCIGCGTCLTHCPVYAEEPREELTARGRNQHIRSLLEMPGGATALKDLGKCLLCGRCTMVCPRGLRNDLVVTFLRRLMWSVTACVEQEHRLPQE